MAPKGSSQDLILTLAGATAATASAQLRCERASAAIELLVKDEELRKMRIRNLLLGDEISDMNEKLCEEFERGDTAELDVQSWRATAEDVGQELGRVMNELKTKARELEILKAELLSMQDLSADSSKLLTEKLGLSRELALLKPEVEHLRSQTSTTQSILTEKLSLQRQLTSLQAELDNEKRTVQRISTKQSKSGEQTAQYEVQIDELKKELAREQRERQKAENTASRASEEQLNDLEEERVRENRERQKAEITANKAHAEQLQELRKELANAKHEQEKAEKSTSKAGEEQLEELRKELEKEKREHQKEGKDAKKAEADWHTQKAVLDDRLDQFRVKMRATKEKLKETEIELAKAQAAAVARLAEPKAKNPRKRAAAQIDPDAAIGTPGDNLAAKRNKRASSVLGEKSTFSITPFLNRTVSVAPSPLQKQPNENDEMEEPIASIENLSSPSKAGRSKAAAVVARKPGSVLGPTSSSKNNIKPVPAARRKVTAATLDKVLEEDEANEETENDPPNAKPTETATIRRTVPKPMLKPKSLTSFASFRDASLPPQQLQKKKQKLLGGHKTIFDEDEEPDEGAFGGAKLSLVGQRAFGAFGGRGFGGMSLLQPKTKGPLMVAADGFMFSPLKKDRKAMAAAAARGG